MRNFLTKTLIFLRLKKRSRGRPKKGTFINSLKRIMDFRRYSWFLSGIITGALAASAIFLTVEITFPSNITKLFIKNLPGSNKEVLGIKNKEEEEEKQDESKEEEAKTGLFTSDYIYTVKLGDTLGSIALKYYGNENEWLKIAEANKLENNQYKLEVGQELIIPR